MNDWLISDRAVDLHVVASELVGGFAEVEFKPVPELEWSSSVKATTLIPHRLSGVNTALTGGQYILKVISVSCILYQKKMDVDEKTQRYLETLDEYQTEIERLSNGFREGFIQLAKANYGRSATNTRFGQDMYDDRMKSVYGVRVSDTGYSVQRVDDDDEEGKGEKEKAKISRNPLNMFGIIVPMSLRQAQQHFIFSVEAIGGVTTSRKRLQELERELSSELPFKEKAECVKETEKTEKTGKTEGRELGSEENETEKVQDDKSIE